jgi:probable F420-dependent oxidoreductase
VLAALRPKMLQLSAELADGAHTYNVTPEHTAQARKLLGPGKILAVEQKILVETDPGKAREAARQTLAFYLSLPNYQENWRTLGFNEDDWTGKGSDRLMDAMVAWGTETQIRQRLQEHWDAGADHVCIQPLSSTGGFGAVDEPTLALFAPKK